MNTVNIFELRNKVRKDIDYIEGAWVEFWDDVTIQAINEAQEAQKTGDTNSALRLVFNQIADWNLADEKGKLEITFDNMLRLPVKILTWMSTAQNDILKPVEDKKKEYPDS